MIEDSSLPVTTTAKALGVSSQAFYNWQNKKKPQDPDESLRTAIHEIAVEFPKYGYRRMTKALHRRDWKVNHKRVRRIMRHENIQVRRKKRGPKTTQSNHRLQKHPNRIKEITTTSINQVWVSDITYIHLRDCFVYLATIMDIYSRRCIGWALSRHPDTQLTLDALNMALVLRGKDAVEGCIHHSDQGVQYAAHAYVGRLREAGMIPSMGEKGNSYENAHAESFFKTLKTEEVWMNEYRTLEEAWYNIKQFIEEVYNKKRLHSGIGYKPPIEFEDDKI